MKKLNYVIDTHTHLGFRKTIKECENNLLYNFNNYNLSYALVSVDQTEIYREGLEVMPFLKSLDYIKTMNTPYKSILYDDSGPIYSNNAIFPINLLRDLSIESIDTTHYFICDIDAFPSKSLYDSIVLHKELLYDHKAVFVLKLFKVITRSKKLANQCRKYGLCNKMYYIKTMN